MNLKAIGLRIKNARETKHYTQEKLAEMVNLSTTHISVIERGVKAPKLETFVDIANALNVTSDFLLLDVLNCSNQIIATDLYNKINDLPVNDQKRIIKAVQALIEG